MAKNMSKQKLSTFSTSPEKHKYEAKIKVTMINNPWNLLYILAKFYMPGIFSSFNTLVQIQLSHYQYHPTLSLVRSEPDCVHTAGTDRINKIQRLSLAGVAYLQIFKQPCNDTPSNSTCPSPHPLTHKSKFILKRFFKSINIVKLIKIKAISTRFSGLLQACNHCYMHL